MIPHIQTDTGKTTGNCWQTAIASVLDLPAERVPHFIGHEDSGAVDNWFTYTWFWLFHHGYLINRHLNRHFYTNEFYLVCGTTERETSHVCIYRNGKMVHDPHPSGVGLLKEYDFYTIRTRA